MQNKKNLLLILSAFFLVFITNVSAQTKTTVLLNKATDQFKYIFDPKALPENTVIDEDDVLLNLNLSENKLSNSQIQGLFVKMKGEFKNIGQSDEINNSTMSLFIPVDLNKMLHKLKNNLELTTSFTSENIQNKIFFYNSLSTSQNFDINKQPKLIVHYEVTKEYFNANWSQHAGNAQYTNTIDWSWTGNLDDMIFYKKSLPLNSCINDKAAVYNGKLIVFENINGTPYMSLIKANNNDKLWSIDVGSSPKVQPIIYDNKMFLFTNDNKLKIVDLVVPKIIEIKELKDINIKVNNSSSFTIKSITNQVTIGYDGTLYLPISNKDGSIGIAALTAYPDLKPRWFYNTTNQIGPISLSKDEKKVFFIENHVNNSSLVVLNNLNGEKIGSSGNTLSSYKNDVNSYIPPVVIQSLNDKSNVYVLNGNNSSNKLFVFQIDNNNKVSNISINPIKTIEASNSINTGISMPIVTNSGNVYFIKEGKLTKYEQKKDLLNELLVSSTFSNESIITASGSDQLFIASTNGLNYVNAEIENPKVINLSTKNGSQTNIYITPYLGIYKLSSNSCEFDQLNFIPNNQNTIELTTFQNNRVYFNNIIKLKATIQKSINAIFIAKEIKFNKGFKIEKGAELSFKIN